MNRRFFLATVPGLALLAKGVDSRPFMVFSDYVDAESAVWSMQVYADQLFIGAHGTGRSGIVSYDGRTVTEGF